jgi:hypothetical protein
MWTQPTGSATADVGLSQGGGAAAATAVSAGVPWASPGEGWRAPGARGSSGAPAAAAATAAAAAAAAAAPLDLACHGRAQACLGRRAARTRCTGRLVCASLVALPLPHPAAPDSMPTHQAASPAGAESSRAISRHWSLRRWAPICAHLRAPIVRAVPSAQHPSAICGGDSQRYAHRRQSICAIWLGPSRPSVRLSIARH